MAGLTLQHPALLRSIRIQKHIPHLIITDLVSCLVESMDPVPLLIWTLMAFTTRVNHTMNRISHLLQLVDMGLISFH